MRWAQTRHCWNYDTANNSVKKESNRVKSNEWLHLHTWQNGCDSSKWTRGHLRSVTVHYYSPFGSFPLLHHHHKSIVRNGVSHLVPFATGKSDDRDVILETIKKICLDDKFLDNNRDVDLLGLPGALRLAE